jgi:tetratricopeptide (TPR) repeat protein
MMNKKLGILSFALMATFFFANNMQGQTKNDVITAINAAAVRTDTVGKIKALEDCIVLCTKVGAPVDSLKGIVSKALPSLYFQKAAGVFKKQKYTAESALAYEEVMKVSQKYSDSLVYGAAKKNLSIIYYELGRTAFDSKKDAEALVYFDKTLALNSKHIKALYYSASAYKRMNNKVKFEDLLAKTLDLAASTNDAKTAADANKMAKNFYVVGYSNSYRLGKVGEAIANLNSALKYSPDDKEILYYLGQAYNSQKKYDLALENINKALALETGKPEDKAKYYYELGLAYEGKNDKANACSSYQNALFGKFTDSAKTKRTTLGCK